MLIEVEVKLRERFLFLWLGRRGDRLLLLSVQLQLVTTGAGPYDPCDLGWKRNVGVGPI